MNERGVMTDHLDDEKKKLFNKKKRTDGYTYFGSNSNSFKSQGADFQDISLN